MPVIRRVKPSDLFHLNLCNLDPYTENYDISFYLQYLMKWPSLFFCLEENKQIVGYIIGKVEASPAYLQCVFQPLLDEMLTDLATHHIICPGTVILQL